MFKPDEEYLKAFVACVRALRRVSSCSERVKLLKALLVYFNAQ